MSIEKCREEFEVWWSQDSQAELRSSCAKGWAEFIWQASRAGVAVELPEMEWLHNDEAREAIEAAGVKVSQ